MDLKTGQTTLEDSFRSSLQDVITIASKLTACCGTTEDLVNVCKLALENDSQLKMLIALVAQTNRR